VDSKGGGEKEQGKGSIGHLGEAFPVGTGRFHFLNESPSEGKSTEETLAGEASWGRGKKEMGRSF